MAKQAKGRTHKTINTDNKRIRIKITEPSLTEESKSMTVQEILARFAGGIAPNAVREPLVFNTDDFDSPDVRKVLDMDREDRASFIRENYRRIRTIADLLKEKGTFIKAKKDKEEAEKAAKDAEDEKARIKAIMNEEKD
jgi:hypothetical protein